MRRCIFILFFEFSLLTFFFQKSFSQVPSDDSTARRIAYDQTVNTYFKSIAENSMINQGIEVIEFTVPSQMHPYFLSDKFSRGEVKANGVNYPNAFLLYDLVHDKLIVQHFSKIVKVEQVNEKVEGFSIQGHEFVRLVPGQTSETTLAPGFYDLLYKGDTISLYAKRMKTVEEQIKDMQVTLVFNEKNKYFLKKGEEYFQVSDRQTAMRFMADKKKEMTDFLKKNKIKFRKQTEHALLRMAAYYDSIKK